MSEEIKSFPLFTKAAECGSVAGLFPLLVDWQPKELLQLIRECGAVYEQAVDALREKYRESAFTPEVFFSAQLSKKIDQQLSQQEIAVLAMTSEITSVAMHYMENFKASPEYAEIVAMTAEPQ